jgi:hypothetical protein
MTPTVLVLRSILKDSINCALLQADIQGAEKLMFYGAQETIK